MKKLFVIILALACFQTQGQNIKRSSAQPVKDSRVEQLMDKRMLTCDDVYYNSLSLLPQFYRSGQTDTMEAVASYWRRYCGLNEGNVAFTILYAIKNGTFTETLADPHSEKAGAMSGRQYYQENIISFLTEYCRLFGGMQVAGYANYYKEAGEQYKSFISEMAVSLMKKDLTPAEKFLAEFYVDPDVSRFKRLTDSFYNGTELQKAQRKGASFGGVYIGMGAGLWSPTGKLSFIGSHPMGSLHFGGRGERFYVDANMQVRFLRSAGNFYTIYQDSLYYSDHHVGFFFGADAGYALLKKRWHELDLQAGIGYDGLEVVANTNDNSNNNNSDNNSKTLSSLNLGAGLGYRLYLTHHHDADESRHSFLQFLVRYNAVSYRNRGGTDFTGNAITFGIIYGGYFNGNRKYYEPR